jgi:hypothetical protein
MFWAWVNMVLALEIVIAFVVIAFVLSFIEQSTRRL